MEPQLPSPNIGPERGQTQPERIVPLASPEVPVSQESRERHESRENQPAGPSDPAPQTQASVPPPLPQLQQPLPGQQQPSAVDDNPAVAADDDLIEREWVEKAKKVIAQTKHDPYLQEQAVSKLQADYLQKRYNKTVKVPDDSAA